MYGWILDGWGDGWDRSLVQQVFLADDGETSGFYFTGDSFGLGLPGAGFVIRPTDSINMDLPSIALGPAGGGVDGPHLTPHRHLELIIIPLPALKLMANTRNPKGPVLRMQSKDVIERFRHILMVILDDLALILLALRQ
jgi:hypothetical protein